MRDTTVPATARAVSCQACVIRDQALDAVNDMVVQIQVQACMLNVAVTEVIA